MAAARWGQAIFMALGSGNEGQLRAALEIAAHSHSDCNARVSGNPDGSGSYGGCELMPFPNDDLTRSLGQAFDSHPHPDTGVGARKLPRADFMWLKGDLDLANIGRVGATTGDEMPAIFAVEGDTLLHIMKRKAVELVMRNRAGC